MPRPSRTGPSVRPIAHRSLVDRVTDELHRSILNGDLPPDGAVSIVELCELFEVSHIPVREALRRLEREGLIHLRPARSAVVAALTTDDLDQTYRLLEVVEGDLIMRAVPAMTDDRLERIRRSLADLTELDTAGIETAARADAHRALHLAFVADVAGEVDRRVLEMLWYSADRYEHVLAAAPESRYAEDRTLVELARAGDPERLRTAWIAHLRDRSAAVREALPSD
ncbi:GntR family transcriptional regulator [Nocardioides mangrovi]|uniref:GntR family transcriptional regulator n=1 Tax=Nocardioides mangrovi TaxID=2874580 RepID=A0ABS7U8C2_9ACTN|nr:GntR family transcriptional regulator [Nocardioides mangrovi]MBZ5737191.1 GntR family transcriptional regulator [Nocardioides mangrovi]